MLSSVGDVDVVEAGCEGDVLHAAAAVLVVFTRHLRLRRALHSDAESADTRPSVKGSTQPKSASPEVGDLGFLLFVFFHYKKKALKNRQIAAEVLSLNKRQVWNDD